MARLWIKKPGYAVTAREPRALAQAEIDDILSVISRPKGPDRLATDLAHQQIINRLGAILRMQRLSPDQLAAMKLMMKQRAEIARVHTGTPVGPLNVEALTVPFTQGSISLAKGGKGDGTVVGELKEIFSAQSNPSNSKLTIHLVDKYISYQSVLSFRREILETNVSDLIRNITIENASGLMMGAWSDLYRQVNNVVLPAVEDPLVMRLTLNIDEMYLRDVKMHQLVEVIQQQDNGIICVVSPLPIGIIDIYAEQRQVERLVTEHLALKATLPMRATLSAFYHIISNRFASILVKGVVGIKQVTPQKYIVYSTVTHSERAMATNDTISPFPPQRCSVLEDPIVIPVGEPEERVAPLSTYPLAAAYPPPSSPPLSSPPSSSPPPSAVHPRPPTKHRWVIGIDKRRMRLSGIPLLKLVRLLNACKIYVLGVIDEPGMIPLSPLFDGRNPNPLGPYNYIAVTTIERGKPSAIIANALAAEKLAGEGPITALSRLWYLETRGSAYDDIVSLEEVDTTLTTSNNIHKLVEAINVDCGYNYLIGEVSNIINNTGAYNAPRSISLVASFMFSRGAFYGTRYHGLVKHEAGTYDLATTQRGLQVIQAAAVSGTRSIIETPSIAITVNNPIPSGTGASYPQVNKEIQTLFESKIPRAPITQVGVEDLLAELFVTPEVDLPVALGREVDIGASTVLYPTLRASVARPPPGERLAVVPHSVVTPAFRELLLRRHTVTAGAEVTTIALGDDYPSINTPLALNIKPGLLIPATLFALIGASPVIPPQALAEWAIPPPINWDEPIIFTETTGGAREISAYLERGLIREIPKLTREENVYSSAAARRG